METGTVKFFNNDKAFGFITPANGSNDVYVHKNGTNENIKEGDKVSYTVQQGREGKGPEAVNVSIA